MPEMSTHPSKARKLTQVLIALTTVLALTACTTASEPNQATDLSTASAAPDYAALQTAIETKIKSGSVSWDTINAVMVSVDGKTVIAHYRNGQQPDQALHVWSVTKSVTSGLIGIAISDGLIESLDQTLAELLPKYRQQMTGAVAKVTLRQLMDMTAGFPGDEPVENIWKVFSYRGDPVGMILADGLANEPGTVYEYSSRSSHLVTAVLAETLRQIGGDHPRTVLDYAREKSFDPLEIDSQPAFEKRGHLPTPPSFDTVGFGWATDAAGLHSGCCMLRLRAADMVKIGELYLGGGVWQGKRILPASWVETSTTPSSLNPEYGLMWLRTTTINQTTAHTTYMARGFDGQLIAVVPDLRLVVAVAAVATQDYAIPGSDVSFQLTDVIIPAVD
jgi:CubicO group peptidase (beta-lactamase class C family)